MDYYHNLCILDYDKDSKSDSSDNDGSNPSHHNHYYYQHQHNHHDYKYQHQQQQLYSIIRKYISQGYLVIYAAECNTSIQSILENMVQNGMNAANLIKESLLIITNSNTIYSIDKATNAKMISQSVKSFVFNLLRKNDNNAISFTKGKKIVTIASPEGFFERGKYSLYLDYEKLLAGGDDDNNNTVVNGEFNNDILLEGICCYNTKLIEKLSFSDLLSLLNAHSYTIHSGGVYREWDREKILELVHRGVIKVMGEVSEKIMLKVLEIVFNTNDDSIILKPDLFESRVRTMIGQKAADIVFSSVSREILKQVTFSHDAE
jgi:hypothetical protein